MTVVSLLCLAAAELTARWIFRHESSTPDNTSYFCIHGYKRNVTLNRYGYRERDFELDKPKGVYRIDVIGDSLTYGQGIERNHRYTDLLQTMLASCPGRFEVLNFGVPGHETIDHWKTLNQTILKTHPDFVLLQWYQNDFDGQSEATSHHYMPLLPNRRLRRILNANTALYCLLNRQWMVIQDKYLMPEDYLTFKRKQFGRADSKETRQVLKLFADMFALCRAKHIKMGVVLFPDLMAPLDDHYPWRYLHRYVAETCQNNQIPYLDLFSDFAAVENERSLWANRLDAHPGEKANLIAAQAIMEAFRNVWVQDALSG